MAIIGTLPNNIQNGQLADAVPLMADLNFIVNQVNANASAAGALDAPSGTRMLFNQSSVPTGWTQETGAAFNDCSLRTVTSAGGGTGGSATWSSWNFGGTFNLNAFTLSVAQLPAHSHTDAGHTHSDSGHTHPSAGTGFITLGTGSGNTTGGSTIGSSANTGTGNANIGVGNANIQNTGSGATIQPTYTTPNVKYTDMIIGIKT